MKTFEIKMTRARWISCLIAILCVVLIVMMLSPYFTYGKASTTLTPADGAQDTLFGRTWVIDGTEEGNENYQKLEISKDGKNSKLYTTNKLRVNQQYAVSVFNTALENYQTMEQNVADSKVYEDQAWAAYLSIAATCNQLAKAMGKDAFEVKDRATETAAAGEESEGEGEETAEEEDDLTALDQEGDPYAEDYKTLSTAMKTANRQLETAIASRETAEEKRDDAKKALDAAYAACLVVFSVDENGEPLGEDDPNRIDPHYAWVRVTEDEYNKALTENFEDDYINAVISVKGDDYKKWLVDENHYINEYAEAVGVNETAILANVVDTMLGGSNKDTLVDGFIKPDSSEFTSYVDSNKAAVTESLYELKKGSIGTSDYEAFALANEAEFKAYVEANKSTLGDLLYADLTDTARAKATYVADTNKVLYEAFIYGKYYDEFAAYVTDAAKKGTVSEDLYNKYIEGQDISIVDNLYAEFVATKIDDYKAFILDLALNGAEPELAAKLTAISADTVQGNLKLMYEPFATANLDSFKTFLTESYAADTENIQYKLYAETKYPELNAWITENNYDSEYKATKDAMLKNADKKRTREDFYTNYIEKLDAATQTELKTDFFNEVEPGLSAADKTKVYAEMNTAILARMSAEERDAAIYSELDNMLAISNAAYSKAVSAKSLTDSAIKDGAASKTSTKAQKAVDNINKQIAKVQPIFDEVKLISAKEAKYNAVMADETKKDEAFVKFLEDKVDDFNQIMLKDNKSEVEEEIYNLFVKAVNEKNLDDLDSVWAEAKAELIAKLTQQLETTGTIDEAYEKFILEHYNSEFKDWLYEQVDDVEVEVEDVIEELEEATEEETEAAEETAQETAEETTEEPESTLSYSEQYMVGKVDPNTLEDAIKNVEPLLMESTATVKYQKRANEDTATVTINFANGETKETTYAAEVKYDGIKTLSILGFVAFPEDYADTFESNEADYTIPQYSRNSVVLLPIILFILLVVGVVLAFVKRDGIASAICPLAAGIIGVIAFLFNTFLKLGNNGTRIAFVIMFAVLLVVSCLQICLIIKDKKDIAAGKKVA